MHYELKPGNVALKLVPYLSDRAVMKVSRVVVSDRNVVYACIR